MCTLDQLTVVDRADPTGILTGRLDLQRAGLAGRSMGAVVGGEACRLEPRLRAGLLTDAMMPADVVRDRNRHGERDRAGDGARLAVELVTWDPT